MVLVVAGNRRDAEFYARNAGLRSWHYIHDARQVYGVMDVDVVIYETFWSRRWNELWPLWERLYMYSYIKHLRLHYADDANRGVVRTGPPLEGVR